MAISLTFGSTTSATTNASGVATATGMTTGTADAGRVVVVGLTIQGDVAVAGVTIGGITAGQLQTITNTAAAPDIIAEFWQASVPTGTTADVVVTLTTATTGIVVGLTTLRLLEGTNYITDTDELSGSGVSIQISGVTIPTGGAGAWVWANDTNNTAVSWTNATEVSDANYSPHRHSVAITTTAGTPTVTADGATAQQCILGVAFALATLSAGTATATATASATGSSQTEAQTTGTASGSATATSVGLQYMPVTVALMLQPDGVTGAQVFYDTGPSHHTITANGNVQIDSAHKRFGSGTGSGPASIKFDGTGDYLTLDGSSEFAFGANDFTIDMWVRLNASGVQVFLYDSRDASSSAVATLYLGSDNVLRYFVSGSDRITGTTALSVSIWYHVAVARKAGSTKLFLNGTQEGSTYSDTTVYLNPASRPIIGAADTGTPGAFLNGWIDELRVINNAALWSANFSPRKTEYYNPIGNLILNGGGADASTTILDSADAGVQHTVTPVGNAQIDTAIRKAIPGAILFDGTGDYLTLDGSSDFAFGTQDFTIDFWVYFTNLASLMILYDSRPASTNGFYPSIYHDGGGKLRVYVNGADAITGTTVLSATTWYHVAVTRQGTSTKLFINGTQEGSTYSDSNTYLVASSRPYVGANANSLGDYFNGTIANLRVLKGRAIWSSNFTPPGYNTVPEPALNDYAKTVLLIHGNDSDGSRKICDCSDRPHSITLYGDVQVDTAQSKFGGSSILFNNSGIFLDGSSDFAFGYDDFTIDCWARFSSTGTAMIYDGRQYSDVSNAPAIYLDSNVIKFHYSGVDRITGTTTIVANTWYHVAVTRHMGSTRLFVNGIQEGSTYADTNNYKVYVSFGSNSTSSPSIGIQFNNSIPVNGWLDEFRIVKGRAMWTSNFVPPKLEYVGDEVPLPYPKNYGALPQPEVLRLSFNGADAATTFTDGAGQFYRTITPAGNAQLDTAQKRFGVSSLLLDGTGDYLTLPNMGEFIFEDNDFTIDFWVRLNSSSGDQHFLDFSGGQPDGQPALHPRILMTSQLVRLGMTGATFLQSSSSLSANIWYHIAIVRFGFELRLFINGTQDATNTTTSKFGCTSRLRIGTDDFGAAVNGWIDELRIVNGRALWTANFIPHGRGYRTT